MAQLVPTYKLALVPTTKSFNVANNKTVHPLGSLNISFLIGKEMFSTQVYVFKELNHSFIIGRPFLAQHKALLNFGNNTITFSSPLKVHATKSMAVKPQSTCLIHGKLTKNKKNTCHQGW